MKLYALDLESFGERLEKAKIQALENGNETDGYVLLAQTERLGDFIRIQLPDTKLFDEKPMYNFRKMEEKKNE